MTIIVTVTYVLLVMRADNDGEGGIMALSLSHGKISTIWAGDDWTAILNDTGTYKAPWIP